MNKILVLITISILALVSCHKSDTSCENSITVIDGTFNYYLCNGTLYTSGNGQQGVSAIFDKGTTKSMLTIGAGMNQVYLLSLQDSTSLGGVGNDTLLAADSNYNTYT